MSSNNADNTQSPIGHFINGQEVSDNSRIAPITNPATGKVTRQVVMASKSTVEDAISAAQAAFPAWRNTPPAKRAQVMFRYKHLLEEHADEIAAAITAEHGVGVLKRGFLDQSRSDSEIALMKTLKQAMDPKGILNPNRVI